MAREVFPGGEGGCSGSDEDLNPPNFQIQPRNARKLNSWPDP